MANCIKKVRKKALRDLKRKRHYDTWWWRVEAEKAIREK